MQIKDFFQKDKFVLSIELMPPRNGIGLKEIYDCVDNLLKFKPAFFTCTQGSSNSLRGGTAGVITEIKKKYNLECMHHLICANKSKNDIENELTQLHYFGVENILALRGDPPWGETEFRASENGFSQAYQLVEEIQKKNRGEYIIRGNDREFFKLPEGSAFRQGEKTDFCVGVAGYPEGHRDCKDKDLNLKHLKQKVDAGADLVFTQMFYTPEIYFEFVEDCRRAGVNVPIIPGIMPIPFKGQLDFLKNTCAVTIPQDFLTKIETASSKQEIEAVS
ncbi:methylenetetrahydrofolate reductase, partial [Candidatus Woesearchaeota archaeon]|nr:methylenetetrahydrofolate reductase [Candidatus Woesearchaeota archaeon]